MTKKMPINEEQKMSIFNSVIKEGSKPLSLVLDSRLQLALEGTYQCT